MWNGLLIWSMDYADLTKTSCIMVTFRRLCYFSIWYLWPCFHEHPERPKINLILDSWPHPQYVNACLLDRICEENNLSCLLLIAKESVKCRCLQMHTVQPCFLSFIQEPLFAARVIYDLLFFFMVIIIVLNLIFGVIIDTFADLRSEKQKKEEVLKTTCFICGECPLACHLKGQTLSEGLWEHISSKHCFGTFFISWRNFLKSQWNATHFSKNK